MPRSLPRTVKLLVLLGLMLPLLSSCYLPDRFRAEIRINEFGRYAINYQGTLTWVPLYAQIAQKQLSKEEIAQKTKQFEDDLKRDSYFKVVEPMGNGVYNVRYEREGVISKSEQVTFVRRNSAILTLEAVDGRLTIRGKSLNANEKANLERVGLPMRGLLRVVSAAKVDSQNADTVKDYQGYQVYDWVFTGDPRSVPKLIMQLK